jgi:hypothetical protein
MTPTTILYEVEVCLNEHIWLIAIAHCKRRPGYWIDRIKTAEQRREGGE